jgi:hypothetical protein
MAIFVSYRYVCDFCALPIRPQDEFKVEALGVPLTPAEVAKVDRAHACSACVEAARTGIWARLDKYKAAAD